MSWVVRKPLITFEDRSWRYRVCQSSWAWNLPPIFKIKCHSMFKS